MIIDKVKIWQSDKKGIFGAINKLRTKSENSKTGDLAGLYVLPIDMKPTDSIKTKTDSLQCGTCPLKGNMCYVNPITTNGVWSSTVGLETTPAPHTSKVLRLGVYGDAGLMPITTLDKVTRRFTSSLGYTHQWQDIDPVKAKYFMASIDNVSANIAGITSERLKEHAQDLGYRTYRILDSPDQLQADEIICPHYSHGVQCADCRLCDGANNKKNIGALIHGPNNKIKTYQIQSANNGE